MYDLDERSLCTIIIEDRTYDPHIMHNPKCTNCTIVMRSRTTVYIFMSRTIMMDSLNDFKVVLYDLSFTISVHKLFDLNIK